MSGIVLTDRTEDTDATPRGVVVPLGTVLLVLALVFALATASLALLVGALTMSRPAPPAASSPPVPAWIDIPSPIQIFSLEAPELSGTLLVYSARRRDNGHSREDSLAFGTFGDHLVLRLRILRGDGAAPAKVPLFAAIVRLAAAEGLSVTRSGLPNLMATRFGAFEVADVSLAGADDKPAVPCSGFRLVVEEPAVSMTGIACGKGAALSRADLACVIDRLDLASDGEDHALAALFAKSELRRDSTCSGTRLAPDQVHAAWLDDKPATPIRKLRPR